MQARFSLLIALSVVSVSCFGQIRFKQGYFIDKQGNKTECFIEDRDWSFAPSTITYRLTESEPGKTIELEKIAESTFDISPDSWYKFTSTTFILRFKVF